MSKIPNRAGLSRRKVALRRPPAARSSNLLSAAGAENIGGMESLFRHMEMTEWMWWLGIAVFMIILGLVLARINRTRSRRKASQMQTRERWKTIINPLAGGTPVWGNRKPSIVIRLLLVYIGMFLLYVMKNPLPGALLILWAVILQVSVYLEKRRSKEASAETR